MNSCDRPRTSANSGSLVHYVFIALQPQSAPGIKGRGPQPPTNSYNQPIFEIFSNND